MRWLYDRTMRISMLCEPHGVPISHSITPTVPESVALALRDSHIRVYDCTLRMTLALRKNVVSNVADEKALSTLCISHYGTRCHVSRFVLMFIN